MPPGASGARTYLLAAAAAGVGLGVRRRAAAAPGRGVKVPGIILVHDPRWGPQRKQGAWLPPPSLRPRTGCCALAACGPGLGFSLCSRASPHGGGRGPGGGDTREQWPPSAWRGTSSLLSGRRGAGCPPRVPPTKKSARPSVPPRRALSRPRAQSSAGTAGPIKNWKLKKNGSPESHACQVGGPRFQAGQPEKNKTKTKRKGCPLGETSISSF